jgi:4-amino-4-deoxy-L-arabinose transferase-like glycosyltransferase
MTDEAAPAPVAETPSWFARAFTFLARRPRLILTVFCLVLWAPGVFSLPPLDRDESRFAQASKQMLESGDLIDIRFGAVPRYKKPAGIYWMQAATTTVAGWGDRNHIWTYRLPSLLGAIAAVWLTFWCARALAGAEVAFAAAALLGASVLLTAEATIATTDAVLLACVLGIQGMLLRAYLAAKSEGPPIGTALALAGWAALGLGILVKGPVVIAVSAITVVGLAVWDRNGRWLRATKPLAGIAVVLVMVAPWVVAIWLKSHGHFFEQSLGQDFATKLQGGQESHGAPPGYFLALAGVSFWPAILFVLPGLAAAIRAHKEPAMRFLLVWTASWVMFELVPTKLPHYVLPTYPALAIMAAVWVFKAKEDGPIWERILRILAPVLFVLAAVGLAAAPVLLPSRYGHGMVWWVIAPAAVFSICALAALIAYLRDARPAAVLFALAAPLTLFPALTAGVAPTLDQLWVSPRAAAAERSLAQPDDPPPALAGYVEPSLVFLLGTETRQTDGRGAADAGAAQGGLALVEDREGGAFKARLAELEADAAEVGAIDGFNYSRGRKVHIRIYRVQPVQEVPPPPPE